jgi:hypothetical protein
MLLDSEQSTILNKRVGQKTIDVESENPSDARAQPIVKEQRKRWNRPQVWEWFEYLYNEMKKKNDN